jgi:RecB family endonuclease NucS
MNFVFPRARARAGKMLVALANCEVVSLNRAKSRAANAELDLRIVIFDPT